MGFDYIERVFEHVAKSAAETYPPYNIEHSGSGLLRITLAVAGFSSDDLKVTVEDSQLVIRGKQQHAPGKTYIHQGIATRQFQRRFVLAEGLKVGGAHLNNGMLSIDLIQPEPVSTVQSIKISNSAPSLLINDDSASSPGADKVPGHKAKVGV